MEMDVDPAYLMEKECQFAAAPWYVDRKGYLWQRLRNGTWASTDGVKRSAEGTEIDFQGGMPPAEWGPYTVVPKPPLAKVP